MCQLLSQTTACHVFVYGVTDKSSFNSCLHSGTTTRLQQKNPTVQVWSQTVCNNSVGNRLVRRWKVHRLISCSEPVKNAFTAQVVKVSVVIKIMVHV